MLMTAAVATVAFSGAAPVVQDSSVTLEQKASREVKIGYVLEGEPAIVTVDIQTNGVSIGGEHLSHMRGDVNGLVQPGVREVSWRPDRAWPGVKLESGVQAVVKAWATNAPPLYLAVNLAATNEIRYYETMAAIPGGLTNDLYKTEWLLMRKIPAANVLWRMGSPVSEANRQAGEKAHLVTLKDDYFIGVYPVTQRQYELVMGDRAACYFTNERDYATRPVEKVSWDWFRGAKADGYDWPTKGRAVNKDRFLGTLRTLVKNRIEFDLPTEAQWEFACRAGTGTSLNSGKNCANYGNDPNANEIARGKFSGGCGSDGNMTEPAQNVGVEVAGTSKVGSFAPNGWHLYDMSGNVWEFCLDWFKEDLTDVDPEKGPDSGTTKVARGGCWNSQAFNMRSAFRNNPYSLGTGNRCFGFRLWAPIDLR